MATSALQERRKRLVNRVGRHLPCNTIQVVSGFAKVATKVVENILSNPADVKFRELRANNKTIQRAVLSCHGGREFLSLLGFEKITKNGEVVYFLAEPHVDHLTQAKGWLAERVKSCEQSEGSVGGRACADSVLTVLLTSGQTLEGGFYKHETIHDVYAFLQSSVVNGGEDLRLRTTTVPETELGEQMLPMSLADAKLLPRATLAVVKPSAAPPPPKKSRRNESEEAAEQLRLLQENSARKNRDAIAEKEKEEAMAKFRADRVARAAAPQNGDSGVEETKGGRR
ncbi:unnamed protein product [Ectocarpus sp. 4 AP-2014]